jgi:hypothetical protein
VPFGPDGCAYVADHGAIRDLGRSDPDTAFKNPADAAPVQIPGTGVIWKICAQQEGCGLAEPAGGELFAPPDPRAGKQQPRSALR